ncbi:hypothetical protein N7471_002541 [Penicillium samsonianum]|uniref:uncharacterized protein n=1 Tax=Penicillium samsonianum TaxID=1882272 RepID=UPI0025494BEC|nr:uncharacterized protein N7471_002541 [Penicillium samsonianum]KAJ6143088.1 hypothetical protein N7471_002541 [Penicillium samsonianum]
MQSNRLLFALLITTALALPANEDRSKMLSERQLEKDDYWGSVNDGRFGWKVDNAQPWSTNRDGQRPDLNVSLYHFANAKAF